jgi:mannose-6-phosphate isomerase-like protein (cupin superfamily)
VGQKAFHYALPEGATDRPKTIVDIARTEIISAGVQIVNGGGETNLHAHNGEDAFWFVIGGAVAFYDEAGERLLLKQHDFILLPSGTKYWFESASDEPLEIIRIGATDPRVASSRTDVTTRGRAPGVGGTPHFQAEEVAAVSV